MTSYSYQGVSRIWKQRDEEENRAIFSTSKQATGITMPIELLQPIYLADAEHEPDVETEKWTVKRLIALLRLYGAHRCLWDARDPDNRNYKLRQAALVDIATAMGEGITRTQVLRKINVLRATYRYEKRRIKERIRKGIGAKTKLKWFALADAFLRNVPRQEKLRKSEVADTDSDLEDTVVFTIDPETLIPIDESEHTQNIPCAAGQVTSDFKIEPFLIGEGGDDYAPAEEFPVDDNTFFDEIQPLTDGCAKQVWTSEDSLQFVQFLKENPVLWQNDMRNFKDEKKDAVKFIAKTMQRPVRGILKRLSIFKRTYKEEEQRINANPEYKPNFVWWNLATSFMREACIEQNKHIELDNVCEETPESPENVQIIKNEAMEENEAFEIAINPIPSVPPPSVNTLDQAVDLLFNKDDDETDYTMSSGGGIKVESPTGEQLRPAVEQSEQKLCNGLEEDLLQDKWSLKHSVKFLRLYGAHSCLWNRSDPDYNSRLMRKAALEDIAAAMGNGLDVQFVTTKIRIFRVTYMQQRKRMLEAMRRGEKPEFKLRWFPLADSFLRPHIGLRSIKEPSAEIPQFDFQYVYTYLNLIDPALLTDFHGKGTQNTIAIGCDDEEVVAEEEDPTVHQSVKDELLDEEINEDYDMFFDELA